MNDIIHRALSSARVPARFEPSGMDRTDGKRPDGITLVPWKNGKLLVWDATCPDTFAPSYISSAISEAGAVASLAEQRKRAKYINLGLCHLFQPVAIETTGAIGPQSLEFLKELGQRLRQVSGESNSTTYTFSNVSPLLFKGETQHLY